MKDLISMKVYVPVLISIVAAVALTLITGNETYLVTILIGLAGGVGGVAAPPAPKVTHRDVVQLSKRRR
jgi:hypothetical protein